MVTYHNRPIRLGTEFQNGKLYLFRTDGIIVASQWPDMRAWRKTPKRPQWKQVRPELILKRNENSICAEIISHRTGRIRECISFQSIRARLEKDPLNPDIDPDDYAQHDAQTYENPGVFFQAEMEEAKTQCEANRAANLMWISYYEELNRLRHADYISPIPSDILEAVLPFRERHWHLLNLIARCPGALDLVTSNPALAMAVSSLWAFRKNPPQRPLRSARALIHKRQSDIAAWLGFPDSRSTVRILRKLPASQCSVYILRALRRLFASHLKHLQHVPSLDEGLIRLLSGERGGYLLSPGFLEEIAVTPKAIS